MGSWVLSLPTSLSQPLSRLLGQGRDPATNHCNGLYMLPWGPPVCQGIAPARSRRLIKLQKNKSEGAGEARGWRGLAEGGRALSASHRPGAGDGTARWLVTLIGFLHCGIPGVPAPEAVMRMESREESGQGATLKGLEESRKSCWASAPHFPPRSCA